MDNLIKPPVIRISKARKELLAAYADSAGCLYGVLSISEFVEVFNHYEDEKTNEQEVKLALQRYSKIKPDDIEYSLYKDFITGPSLQPDEFDEDEESLHGLRNEQKGKPRYMPIKEEFPRYADSTYFEPKKPYVDLKTYILKNKLHDKEGLDGIDGDLIDLHEMIQHNIEPTMLLQYFINEGCAFHNIDVINEFMQILMTVHNNTRMYENNGFTPNELRKIYDDQRPKEPVIHFPKKVGRNDPCPCGSGKKFKRCCSIIEASGAAQLSYSERKLFYDTWYRLLDYVNRKLRVVNYKFSLSYPDYHDETLLHKIRDRLWESPELIGEFISDSGSNGNLDGEEISLLHSWENRHIKGQFALVKYAPDAAILMQIEEDTESMLYAVKGMTASIAETMHRKLPVMLETVLLPFKDKIIYDSFMASRDVQFGNWITDMFEGEYTKLEQKNGIITKL